MSNPHTPIARFDRSPRASGQPAFQLTAFGHETSVNGSDGGPDLLQMIVVQGIAPVPDGMWPVFESQQATVPDVLPLRIVFVKQVSTPPLDSGFGNCNYGIALAKFGSSGWGPAKQLKLTHPDLGDLMVDVQPLAPGDQ